MPPKIFIAAYLLLSGWPASSSLAQDEDSYRVEVIVFARPALRISYYRWPGEPDISDAIDLTPSSNAADLTGLGLVFGDAASQRFNQGPENYPSPLTPAKQAFELLDPAGFTLAEDWRRLAESRDYQPLVHLAWRQPAASFGDPQPVRVHGGGAIEQRSGDASYVLRAPERVPLRVEAIDGTVAFERGRYLHLRIDISLHLPAAAGHQADPITLENTRSFFTFRLSERRQIQAAAVNYFDHQRFGLIAVVEKWQPPDPALSTQR